MIINITKACNIYDLQEPIRTAVYANMNIQHSGTTNPDGYIDINTAFTWDLSLEMNIDDNADGDLWSRLYDGGEIEIPQKYLDFWNWESIKIESCENNIYYGKVNNKKVKIEITYLDE